MTRQDDHVVCSNGHTMPCRGGYIDVSDGPSDPALSPTIESFGYEWTTFDKVQPEDSEFWQVYAADLNVEELAGRVALDAGCGKGRYTAFIAPHVRELVALDASRAVEAAVRNLAPHPNVTVVKSDLRRAPFAPLSFGFISCLGVLHHLPQPRSGFEQLVELLAPGGIMLLYVYSRPTSPGVRDLGLRGAALLRRLTVRLPHPVLRLISTPVAYVLYGAVVAPGRYGEARGRRMLSSLPLASYRGKPVRSLGLDTFDRLSAPIEHRYTWPELEPWFSEAGLIVDAVREAAGLYVLARKPE